MTEKKSWMIITEWLTVLGTLVACFLFLHSQIQSLGNDLKEINISLNERIDQTQARIDQTQARIDQTQLRIDQMYAVLLKTLEKNQ